MRLFQQTIKISNSTYDTLHDFSELSPFMPHLSLSLPERLSKTNLAILTISCGAHTQVFLLNKNVTRNFTFKVSKILQPFNSIHLVTKHHYEMTESTPE